MPDPSAPRLRGGLIAIFAGGVAIALVAAGIVGGAVDLGLGGAPQVRIDAPMR